MTKTIVLKQAHTKDGLLIILTDVKDDQLQTINEQYPNVIQEIANALKDCNWDLSAKIYGMSVTCSYDYCDGWLFGRVYIRASSPTDFATIEAHTYDKLKKLFWRMNYSVSNTSPED